MKQVWDACAQAGVSPPSEVEKFFGGESPDENGVMPLSKADIYDLDDEALVARVAKLDVKLLPPHAFPGLNEKPTLTDWERSFISGLQTTWVAEGDISWRQRKAARELLWSIAEREARRVGLNQIRRREAAK